MVIKNSKRFWQETSSLQLRTCSSSICWMQYGRLFTIVLILSWSWYIMRIICKSHMVYRKTFRINANEILLFKLFQLCQCHFLWTFLLFRFTCLECPTFKVQEIRFTKLAEFVCNCLFGICIFDTTTNSGLGFFFDNMPCCGENKQCHTMTTHPSQMLMFPTDQTYVTMLMFHMSSDIWFLDHTTAIVFCNFLQHLVHSRFGIFRGLHQTQKKIRSVHSSKPTASPPTWQSERPEGAEYPSDLGSDAQFQNVRWWASVKPYNILYYCFWSCLFHQDAPNHRFDEAFAVLGLPV